MKNKITSLILALSIIFSVLSFSACAPVEEPPCEAHIDGDSDGLCDNCGEVVPPPECEGHSDSDLDGMCDFCDEVMPVGLLGITDVTRYSHYRISPDKISATFSRIVGKVDFMMESYGENFPANNSKNNVYKVSGNTAGWWQGFWPGILWHTYEMTGDAKYKELASTHVDSFHYRITEKLGCNHHDMGFLFIPSCVAAYKLDGNEYAKMAAFKAAEHLITRYNEEAGFIQAWGSVGDEDEFRLIVDCLLNIPLLYWASEVSGNDKYRNIAYDHLTTTLEVCYREDGSTYHTYYFDTETGEPLRGATAQGAGDETTWSRGQAWGMYGPLLSYIYVEDERAMHKFKMAANYYLSYLPEDYIAYWDLSYTDGSGEPRDSSSAAIAVCALLESAKHLKEDDPYRDVYLSAAHRIMESLIDGYLSLELPTANGILLHGTNSMSANNGNGAGVDEMNAWGDYFFIEALHRFMDPEWELYW